MNTSPRLWNRVQAFVFAGAMTALTASAGLAASTSFDPSPYLHAQRLVDIGGRRLNLYCIGTGSPTVVLDAPAGATNKIWYKVAPQVARTTRVCAYDRAGMGFSDAGPLPRDASAAVRDLHTLLLRANVASPYVLVAHSISGLYARLYADRYPAEVAGMVLVDPAVPDQQRFLDAVTPESGRLFASSIREAQACGLAAAAGNLKPRSRYFLRCGLLDNAAMRKDCAEVGPSMCAIDELNNRTWQRAAPWLATASELRSLNGHSSKQVLSEQRSYGAMPFIVLTAANAMNQAAPGVSELKKIALQARWRELHDEVAALSAVGVNFTVAGSGHVIEFDMPAAVVSAIDEVVDQARYHPASALK